MLLEFLYLEHQRNEKTQFFPFLQGVARAHGFEVRWLCFGVDLRTRWYDSRGRTTYADLQGEDLAVLRGHLARFRPTHVVSGEVLAPDTRQAIEQAPGSPRLLVLPLPQEYDQERFSADTPPDELTPYKRLASWQGGDRFHYARQPWFLRWLDVLQPSDSDAYLVEAAPPDYDAVLANPEARRRRSALALLSGFSCSGRPCVTTNPYFQGVDLGEVPRTTGCSFCGGSPPPPIHSAGADRLALAELQLRRIRETAGEGGRDAGVFDVYDLGLFHRIDEFFQMVLRLGVPPATFLFCPRIDDVLNAAPRIDRVLPEVAKAGHRVRFAIMGLESFWPDTLRRFNKDIDLAQVDRLLALQDRWEATWPQAFLDDVGLSRGGWSMILFTPWTTVEETRHNLTEAAARGFRTPNNWIYSSLLVRRGTPIAALARHDGDLRDEYPDPAPLLFQITSVGDNLFGLLPWAFRDPAVATFYGLLARWCAAESHPSCTLFEGEARYAEVCRRRAAAVSGWPGREPPWSTLDLARELLEVVASAPSGTRPEELLDEALGRLTARFPSVDASPLPPAAPLGGEGDDYDDEEPSMPVAPASVPAPGVRHEPPGGIDDAIVSPEAARVARLFQALERRREGAGGDVRLGTVRAVPRGDRSPVIECSVVVGGRELVLVLAPPGEPGPCFVPARHFHVSHRRDTPVTTPRERAVLQRVAAAVDHAFDASPNPLGTEATP
jgi:hypothetical protein